MKKIILCLFLLYSYSAIAQVTIVKQVDWYYNPDNLTKVGNKLFFTASDVKDHNQLWVSDGSAAGTVMIKDFTKENAYLPFEKEFVDVNGLLYFTVNSDNFGYELWKSDGTEKGTVMVKDILPGKSGSNPENLIRVGNNLYFICDDGIVGKELWKTDGTAVGTNLVKDLNPGPNDGGIYNLTNVGNVLFFSLTISGGDNFLYKTDGTAAGTVSIGVNTDVVFGGGLTAFRGVQNTLFFTLINLYDNNRLYKSDGSTAGTSLVKDYCGNISEMTAVANKLFFYTNDCKDGRELQISDGTPNGTRTVKNINLSLDAKVRSITDVNGVAFFVADDGNNGAELWVSDGTEERTFLVKNIRYGYFDSNPQELCASGKILYFTADPGDNPEIGRELWRSDGTETGTYLVKDIYLGKGSSNPRNLVDVNGVLFFVASDSSYSHLWKIGESKEATCILPSVYTLSTTNITPNTATLNSGMSGFSTYEFNYRSVESSNWAAIETTNSSMLIVNLVASTQYEFRVRVKCADNSWSEWTGNEVFSTSGSGTNTCVLPQVYTLSTSNIAKNSATLNSGLSGFSQYEFNYRKVGGNTWETVSSVNSSITLSSLSSSTPYEFRVRARCTNLEWSTFTGNESFTTLVDEGSSNDKAQLYLSTTRASATDTARITVRANNFKDIGGFQFSVAIPSGKAKIVGIDNATSFPGLLIRQEAPERWGFIWYDPNLTAKTLPDSSVLVTLKVVFNTNVAENECVPIVFDIDPTDIVVSTLINQEVGEYIPSTANGEVCLLSTAKLKGKITNTAGLGVNAVRVNIGGKISTTNDKGEYEMPQLLRGRTYVIKPLKTGNHKNGVNVVDVVTIRQHILGDKPFGDPYRYIVSDVNGSGSVNVADVVIIQQLILGQIDSFSRNWVFVPANYRFSSPAAAIKEKFPEEITITNLDGDKNEQNFIGLKMGDANNSASPKAKLIDRPGLSIATLTMQAGQKLEIPVYPHELNYIKGFQCELSTQNSRVLEMLGITLNEQTQLKSNNFDLSDIQSGALRILWLENLQSSLGLTNDKPLFLLQVQAKANLNLAKQLYINSADFENQFVDEELNWVKGTLIFDLTSQEKGVEQQIPSPKIYPNPSSTDPTIEFSLAHSADYTIDVFAGSGSKIKTYSIQGLPGVNQTKLDGMAAFPGGVYQYRINLPGDVLIGKFLIVK